jgi:hypothetical protein
VGRSCNTCGDRIYAYRILVRKQEGKRPLGRHRRRWEDSNGIALKEIEWDGVD